MWYEKFEPDEKEFLELCVDRNGCISALARHYSVTRSTIYQYLKKQPEGKKIIDYVRGIAAELYLDKSEYVTEYNMDQYKENPAIAQKAADRVAERFGHLRGYGAPQQNQDYKNQENLDLMHENMILKNQITELMTKITDLMDRMEKNGNKT